MFSQAPDYLIKPNIGGAFECCHRGAGGTRCLPTDPHAVQARHAVEETISRDYARKAVREALEQLAVEERLAVKAYYYEGRTRRQAGGAVLERAELRLRCLLEDKREGML